MEPVQQDSPLSTSANIAGIISFIVATIAGAYARITYLRNCKDEYFRVKAWLPWLSGESTSLSELINAADERPGGRPLEQSINDLLAKVETRAAGLAVKQSNRNLVAPSWSFIAVALAWLPVRNETMELVRQREALTARVQFTQMSMTSTRIRDLEARMTRTVTKATESFIRMENQMVEQRAQIHRLEELVYRLMHGNRLGKAADQSSAEAVKVRRGSKPQQGPTKSPKRGRGRRSSY
ncbi:hypothetical protein C8034_v004261 [Colletotrichum sidae]|uniref:Uncharacterized protein n=1 Tax=Colletotrichum sidae TaxID=1347389 RepID=A0A4R8TNL1_9PEZI|nr:hypothetical protein C8034_v004261 [Colletotrichum sidae]